MIERTDDCFHENVEWFRHLKFPTCKASVGVLRPAPELDCHQSLLTRPGNVKWMSNTEAVVFVQKEKLNKGKRTRGQSHFIRLILLGGTC